MSCNCKSTLPRRVPARDVGLRSSHKSAGYSQLMRADRADKALAAPPAFAKTRNAAYLGVNVHVGGSREGKEVKLTRFSPIMLLALGGVLWFATRAR